jgi:hypothetical protein
MSDAIKTWKVQTAAGGIVYVKALYCLTSADGRLIFHNQSNDTTAAFAAGVWLCVTEADDE